MGATAFRKFLADPENIVESDTPAQQRVSRIFTALVEAAKKSPHADTARDFEWKVVLLKNEKKAACSSIAGGKVIVYSGLLLLDTIDSELAGAVGHCIARSLARHAGEGMSRSILTQIGQLGAIGAASSRKNEDPTSMKTMEEEADHIGLLLAADAGYDPDEAVNLWIKFDGPLSPRKKALESHLQEAREHFHTRELKHGQ